MFLKISPDNLICCYIENHCFNFSSRELSREFSVVIITCGCFPGGFLINQRKGGGNINPSLQRVKFPSWQCCTNRHSYSHRMNRLGRWA
jgi:hypothetical protein